MISLAEEKRSARIAALNKRTSLVARLSPGSGDLLADRVAHQIPLFAEALAVSGFLPIGDEIDILPSLRRLSQLQRTLCLPVVVKKDHPLIFRVWQEGDALEAGPLTTRHPLPSAPECSPDIVLVPLLAFDLCGYRLGWGGGFYDRTLAGLKRDNPNVRAVGIGFDAQQVARVPADSLDVPMDWIITEKRTLEIEKAPN